MQDSNEITSTLPSSSGSSYLARLVVLIYDQSGRTGSSRWWPPYLKYLQLFISGLTIHLVGSIEIQDRKNVVLVCEIVFLTHLWAKLRSGLESTNLTCLLPVLSITIANSSSRFDRTIYNNNNNNNNKLLIMNQKHFNNFRFRICRIGIMDGDGLERIILYIAQPYSAKFTNALPSTPNGYIIAVKRVVWGQFYCLGPSYEG